MIQITDKANCCGCNACGDACAHQAITFKTDNEGFWYPEVDTEKCVECGLCEKVCPIIHIDDLKKNDFAEPEVVIANHKNIEVRFDSTSGGMFTAFAEKILKDGGYIGGAIFNEDFSVRQLISNQKEDLLKIRNSKYVQSDSTGFYKEVKRLLLAGEKVLICSLPCQIAALKAFLRKDYPNLITVDLFCRGINSPKVFRKFLDSLEHKYDSKVVYVKPKSKELGWHNLTLKVVFENGKTYYGTKDVDFFTRAFLGTSAITRPSCFKCPFKGFPRLADISIGDYWVKGKTEALKLDDNLGTSAILINSEKGKAFFSELKKLDKSTDTLESVVKGNPALVSCIAKDNFSREHFYEDLDKIDFIELVDKYFTHKDSFKKKIKNSLRNIKHQISLSQFHITPLAQFIKFNFLHPAVKGASLCDNRLIYFTPYCVVELDKQASLTLKGSLTIGTSVYKNTKAETRLRMQAGAEFHVNGDWSYGYGGNIEIFRTGRLIVERGPWANTNLCIICQDKIFLDEWAMIGRDVTIRDNNGGHPIGIYGYRNSSPIIIGKHVWLCSGATVMGGVKIGDGTIVGANSMVTTSFPAHCVVSGFPAVINKRNVLWRM